MSPTAAPVCMDLGWPQHAWQLNQALVASDSGAAVLLHRVEQLLEENRRLRDQCHEWAERAREAEAMTEEHE